MNSRADIDCSTTDANPCVKVLAFSQWSVPTEYHFSPFGGLQALQSFTLVGPFPSEYTKFSERYIPYIPYYNSRFYLWQSQIHAQMPAVFFDEAHWMCRLKKKKERNTILYFAKSQDSILLHSSSLKARHSLILFKILHFSLFKNKSTSGRKFAYIGRKYIPPLVIKFFWSYSVLISMSGKNSTEIFERSLITSGKRTYNYDINEISAVE